MIGLRKCSGREDRGMTKAFIKSAIFWLIAGFVTVFILGKLLQFLGVPI